MSRLLLVGAVLCGPLGFGIGDAIAQRDAGAKARGEFGTGFWNPKYQRAAQGAFVFQRARDRDNVEAYRRFSYPPVPFQPGTSVVVMPDRAKLMLGKQVVGVLEKGQELQITKVIGGWLGTQVEVDGKKLNGWIWHRNVAREQGAASSPGPQASRGEPAARSYRRFSYWPSPVRTRTERPSRRTYRRRPTPPEVRQHPGIGRY